MGASAKVTNIQRQTLVDFMHGGRARASSRQRQIPPLVQ
jgi:hypothetical protein